MQTQVLSGFTQLKPATKEFDIDEISKKIDEKIMQTKQDIS